MSPSTSSSGESSDEHPPPNTDSQNRLNVLKVDQIPSINISNMTDGICLEDLSEDNEIFLFQCPKTVDINTLKGQKIQLPGHSDFVIDPKKGIVFECTTQSETNNRNLNILLPSRKTKEFTLRILPLTGCSTFCKKVEVLPVTPPTVMKKTKIPYPDFIINKNPALRQLLPNAIGSISQPSTSSISTKAEDIHHDGSHIKKKKKKKEKKLSGDATLNLSLGDSRLLELSIMNRVTSTPNINTIKIEAKTRLEDENTLPTQTENETVTKKKKHHKRSHNEPEVALDSTPKKKKKKKKEREDL